MNITINGTTKDCTQWGCENIIKCEHGCVGFEQEYDKFDTTCRERGDVDDE